ncbi:winged helix-turn-helix transcriptional regulator [Nonomuraea cavernae]|uniref:winged helix-turn-helix transcriptional regulator n=1 Tax=Nonomuraea cavernae TaxID=2045107 RepID=UPI0033E01582
MDEKNVIELLNLVGRQWTLPVLDELARGARSHNDLARAIDANHQQLARVLRPLVSKHLVHRKVHEASPPIRVYYMLTPRGKAVLACCCRFRTLAAGELDDAM